MQTLNLTWVYTTLILFNVHSRTEHRIPPDISTTKDLRSITKFPLAVELWLLALVCAVVIVLFLPFWMLLGLYDDKDNFSPLIVWKGVWYGNPFLLVWVFNIYIFHFAGMARVLTSSSLQTVRGPLVRSYLRTLSYSIFISTLRLYSCRVSYFPHYSIPSPLRSDRTTRSLWHLLCHASRTFTCCCFIYY